MYLDDIFFFFWQGELHIVVGPVGAGKVTNIFCIIYVFSKT